MIRVFRLGVVTLGPTWVRLDNRTNHTRVSLDAVARARWAAYLVNAGRAKAEIDTLALPAAHKQGMASCGNAPRRSG